MGVVLLLVAAALACEDPVPSAELVAELTRAEHDPEVPARVRSWLPCVTDRVLPADAALLHRVFAMDAWRRGDTTLALVEMRAAHAADPGWPAPLLWQPRWARAAEPTAAGGAVTPGTVVDGVDDAPIYVDRAAIVQSFEGGSWRTRYLILAESADLAELEGAPIAPPPVHGSRLFVRPRPTSKSPLLVAGGACLAVGVASWATSAVWNAQFHDLDAPGIKNQDELADLGNRTNVAAGVAAGLGVTGAGLLFAGFYTVQFE